MFQCTLGQPVAFQWHSSVHWTSQCTLAQGKGSPWWCFAGIAFSVWITYFREITNIMTSWHGHGFPITGTWWFHATIMNVICGHKFYIITFIENSVGPLLTISWLLRMLSRHLMNVHNLFYIPLSLHTNCVLFGSCYYLNCRYVNYLFI